MFKPIMTAVALALAGAAGADDALERQVAAGGAVFAEACAICHGAAGEGGDGYPNAIVGGRGLYKFRSAKRLFDYTAMMMPFDDPGSLGPDRIWEVTAWLMRENGWLDGLAEPLGPGNAAQLPIAPAP